LSVGNQWSGKGPDLKSLLVAFVLALVASCLLTPLIRSVAFAQGFVARTGGRHIHAGRIPRIGGIALALGWGLALLAFLPLSSVGTHALEQSRNQFFGILAGALFLCVIGAVDDIRGLRVHQKLAAQIGVAMLAYACGVRVEAILLPFVGTLSMGVFALPVTVLWVVGITNAVNLIDGLDGLAAGVSLFAAVTGLVVAVQNGSLLIALSLSALIGVLVGFLFYNWNPARVFMGDSGSYFLGYVLATTSLAGSVQQKASTAVSLLIPMVALGLPIFDTLFSMLRRFLERRPIFSPDQGHIHHRLLELGLTHRRAVVVLYGVSIAFACCAVLMAFGGGWGNGGALLIATLVLLGLMRQAGYFDYLHRRGRVEARIYDGLTERLRRAMPEVLESLRSSEDEREVFRVVRRTIGDAGCSAIEFRAVGEVQHRFEASEVEPVGSIRRTFPLGPDALARAHIDFVWHVDEGEPSVQASILLQLVVDGLAAALGRSGSTLSPAKAPEPVRSERPAPAAVALPGNIR
jgi:UDP-GlcNAc:undecaprenyl-phosphate GlcNAc-1-phosphate transferase